MKILLIELWHRMILQIMFAAMMFMNTLTNLFIMRMKEKIFELDSLLSDGFKRYGFIRKKKYTYQCKIEQGVQEIAFVTTKMSW